MQVRSAVCGQTVEDGESFLLPVWCGDLLEVGLLAEGSWVRRWSGQLPDGQETFMEAEWATSHS